jgi:hypothetical protein
VAHRHLGDPVPAVRIAALQTGAAIAIKGAPEQHAEGADIPGDEDG